MSRNRFTVAEPHRIHLSEDEWIDVKKDLSNGDSKKLEAAGLDKPVSVDGKIIRPIDWERYEIERAAIFLIDWNLRDGNNKEIPIKRKDGSIDPAALRALNPEDFDEINTAIMEYTLARSAEKNALRGRPSPTPTPKSDDSEKSGSDTTSTPSSGSDSAAGTPS